MAFQRRHYSLERTLLNPNESISAATTRVILGVSVSLWPVTDAVAIDASAYIPCRPIYSVMGA